MPGWMFWMPEGAMMNEMLIFTVILWTIHQVFSAGTSAVFNYMHKKDWFSHLRFAKGKAPPDDLYRAAWKEWFITHIFFLPFFMGLVLYPLFLGARLLLPPR